MSLTENTKKALEEARNAYIDNIVSDRGQAFADGMDALQKAAAFSAVINQFATAAQMPQEIYQQLDSIIGTYVDMTIDGTLKALGMAERADEIMKSHTHMMEQLMKIAQAEARAEAIIV